MPKFTVINGPGDDDPDAETVIEVGETTIRMSGNSKVIISDGPMHFSGWPPRLDLVDDTTDDE